MMKNKHGKNTVACLLISNKSRSPPLTAAKTTTNKLIYRQNSHTHTHTRTQIHPHGCLFTLLFASNESDFIFFRTADACMCTQCTRAHTITQNSKIKTQINHVNIYTHSIRSLTRSLARSFVSSCSLVLCWIRLFYRSRWYTHRTIDWHSHQCKCTFRAGQFRNLRHHFHWIWADRLQFWTQDFWQIVQFEWEKGGFLNLKSNNWMEKSAHRISSRKSEQA